MKLLSMRLIPDEDAGTEFHSVAYTSTHFSEFKHWCQSHCRGEWGCEESSVMDSHDISLWFGWMYDDQDAMLFKLTFA